MDEFRVFEIGPLRATMTKVNGNRKKIAFDTWTLGEHARNQGVHVYASKLLTYFREMGSQYSVEITPYVSSVVENDANVFEAAPGFRPKQTGLLQFDRLWRFGGACALASTQGADLIFSPHCTTLYAGSFAPVVVTIHDLIPVLMPWKSKRVTGTLRFLLWSSAKFSRAIITDSQNSKTDLVNTYGLPESKISVISLGYDRDVFNNVALNPALVKSLLKKLGIQRPYLLHHGAIKPNKNLQRLIQAYRLLMERNRSLDFDLVLAGTLGWEYEEVLAAANHNAGSRGNVVLTGALSDADLVTLIKGASLAVIPSLYEGFCIPMVECMACGIPTIAANSSCLPEISGGVLRYFDPQSVEAIAVCMEEVLENESLKKELTEKGLVRANAFGWKRCAEETLALLAKLAGNGQQ